mgnify:CR=1 FL=1
MYKEGLFKEGLAVDLRLVKLKPDDPLVRYNLACSYSLLGELDRAYAALKKAILLGFEDFSHLTQDRDLENLRNDRRFRRLMNKMVTRFKGTKVRNLPKNQKIKGLN